MVYITLSQPFTADIFTTLCQHADNNLTQHVHETTRQNNILDLVISTEEELIVNLKITDKIGEHQAITFSIKTEKGNISSEKNNYNYRRANFYAMRTELDYQTFEHPIVRNTAELGFEILKNRINDASRTHIPKRRADINNPSWINNDVKQAIGRRQRGYETKRRIKNEETITEFIAARREVKRIVKQEKRNKEFISIARICKHNPKSFYSYINERRIVRYNMGPLKTMDGIVITNDTDMAKTMNNYLAHCSPLNN